MDASSLGVQFPTLRRILVLNREGYSSRRRVLDPEEENTVFLREGRSDSPNATATAQKKEFSTTPQRQPRRKNLQHRHSDSPEERIFNIATATAQKKESSTSPQRQPRRKNFQQRHIDSPEERIFNIATVTAQKKESSATPQ